MASIFTYQEEPPRVHSPWSTSGNSTPKQNGLVSQVRYTADGEQVTTITKLEPERQDGPTEYKLHLLLRPRRYQETFSSSQTTLSNARQSDAAAHFPAEISNGKPVSHMPLNSRQVRLQQLTTQLLWRLQQSSPFHSSSNADLVLPVLPEATPRLGVPDRPATLLPGLEESQGALYEIGVGDDGTLVGLIEEEMEESLNNLRAMASSLGCVVDILRRVLVAQYERTNPEPGNTEAARLVKVWVAEVLVRPESKSPRIPPLEEAGALGTVRELGFDQANQQPELKSSRQQMRIAVTGPTTAGKSSLVGTLTTSTLDNGRGKSRLSLLKHRHEIASGVTSSVAQELLGYRKNSTSSAAVINYATGDVSSWPDIHNLANRLIFLSDSPGLPRFAKSTFRTLISWEPNWTLVCIAADEFDVSAVPTLLPGQTTIADTQQRSGSNADPIDVSLAHLFMCLKLGLTIIVVITKMDIATKTGLKSILSRILSALKSAGRTPSLLGATSNTVSLHDENVDITSELAYMSTKERSEIDALLHRMKDIGDGNIVPIVLTSAVTGAGVGKLHALLRELDPFRGVHGSTISAKEPKMESLFHVDEIFAIPPSKVYSENKAEHSADHGVVLCGHLATGRLAIGDQLRLGPFVVDAEAPGSENDSHTPRSASYCLDNTRRPLPRALSGLLSKSLQTEQQQPSNTPVDGKSTFLDVHVVSLRSLRLPVRSMDAGETGTVGVQPLMYPSSVPLSRARKGMVLTSAPGDSLYGYRSFSAVFPASDFTNTASPTLILGGHAIVYINSIRAAVKVTVLALEDDGDSGKHTEPSSPSDVFSFDDDDDEEQANGNTNVNGVHQRETEARIVFRFVSSIEWIEVGSRVLIVPTLTAAGPITGPPVVFNGLNGFVGRVCDVFT